MSLLAREDRRRVQAAVRSKVSWDRRNCSGKLASVLASPRASSSLA